MPKRMDSNRFSVKHEPESIMVKQKSLEAMRLKTNLPPKMNFSLNDF